MVKPFSDAVGTMEDGEFTSVPVQTQFGWHVILREEHRDLAPPTLDEVRQQLMQQEQQEKQRRQDESELPDPSPKSQA